jgi:subtilisin family serine protease
MKESLLEAVHTPFEALVERAREPVAVAVIDSGVDMSHPDLAERVARSLRIEKRETMEIELGTNNDAFGHGTAVAGIISRIAPNARIIDIRVLHPGNIGTGDDLVSGLHLMVRERVPLINMSLAAPARFVPQLSTLCERAFYQNQIVVAARRNVPITDEGYPAEFSTCLGVESGNFVDPLALCYRVGKIIELEAHGEHVPVLKAGGGYTTLTGTSFATPAITGICALLLGAFPDLLPFEVRTLLSHYRLAPLSVAPEDGT